MINKQKIWYLTLFSLILILGVYYITMPSETLKETKKEEKKKEQAVVEEIKEENILATMRVSLTEERNEQIENLKEQLTDEQISTDDKNNIYEKLKYLNEVQSKEEKIENKIKKELNIDCFIKEQNKDISCICLADNHDVNLANNIMRLIQKEYKDKVTTQVKFQK